jgi:methionyl-tRNA synthetase
VRQGLEDIAVSRAGLKWGIPVPFDPTHLVYVWIGALTNYLNALEGDRFARFWPADLHVVGKDIARFHVVIWPALLLALGLPLPKQVYAHGWLNLNGERISKSKGNTVDPWLLIRAYGTDAVRYYLLREVGFGQDTNYTEDALVLRLNTDLANDLGNLLSRTTQLINKFSGGLIPDPGAASDGVLAAAAADAVAALEGHLAGLRISEGLAAFWSLIRRANKYVEEQAPWLLARDPAQQARLAAVLYDLAEALRVAAGALSPFLVAAPRRICEQLGLDGAPGGDWTADTTWGGLRPGTAVRRGAPLFPRIQQGDAAPTANASATV